jgi:hypothetical protein
MTWELMIAEANKPKGRIISDPASKAKAYWSRSY